MKAPLGGRRHWLATALVLAFGFPGFLVPPGSLMAQSWWAGGSVHESRIPNSSTHPANCGPYATYLPQSDVQGGAIHVGRELGLGFQLRLQVSRAKTGPALRGCPDNFSGKVDGVHAVTLHRRPPEGPELHSADFTLAFSPEAVPLRAGATVGQVKGARTPYFAVGIGLRSRTSVRIFADLGLRFASVRYEEYQEEWQDLELVSWEELGRGRKWVSGREWRLGLEFPFE